MGDALHEAIERGFLVDPDYQPTFEELAEDFPNDVVPLLDQNDVHLQGLSEDQKHWRDYGYVIKRNFIPADLIDEYIELRDRLGLGHKEFPTITAYTQHECITDMCCSKELHYLLCDLLGEEMGIHFDLTSFKSTRRGWHQDDYLNPPEVRARYLAIWMAMGDIHPDAGPFEYVPGSHKWPCLRSDRVRALIKPEFNYNENMIWPTLAEGFVGNAVERRIAELGVPVKQFLAKKGDILIWHGKLMHRGSIPKNSDLLRPAIIGHYSNIRDRRDFSANISRHNGGGYYWNWGNTPTRDKTAESTFANLKRSLSDYFAFKRG